ncbi:restriction endonuclease subunit S [uncultured Muribaculum sp.]|uniref:restriction endonuclease subunit S n=1 Tax=uncultured Muribaculum sp. TaxID=1918613 RepID=UPI00262C4EF2|nr:restriction endonuclease subunit S [uncultured Muribaculum sp.]
MSDTPHYGNVPFEIPDNWVWCRLEDIANIGTGATPNRLNKEYYNNGIIPWINSSSTNCTYITEASEYITEKAINETNCKIYPIGTLIVAMYGEGKTRGQVSELLIESATNQACAAISLIDTNIKAYIKNYFEGNYFHLRKLAEGGNQPNLSIGKISNYTIPLPPLSEQHRITTEIEKCFSIIDIIECGKADLQTAIKQAKSKILDLAIHGKLVPQDPNDEPAIELLKRINPDFTPCDNGHYTQLPDGWTIAPMEILCSLVDGCKQNGIERINLDVKYLRGERDAKTLISGKYVVANSLLILVDGENSGEVFITPIEGYQGSTFKQLSINDNLNTDYILQVINLHRKTLRENKVGSAIPHLNKKLFKAIEVPIPPYNEQQRIVEAINKAFMSLNLIMESL